MHAHRSPLFLSIHAHSENQHSVPDWSAESITSGSVSSASSAAQEFNFKILKERPVKSVFTYAAGGGNDSYNIKKITNPFKTINLIAQARNLEASYGSCRHVMPVIVIYTRDH
ncbi:MAG: hypothetical protein ACR2PX_18375 [Endozoicomonas sp.]|uniref:hypothetical protein n=1 Tax=Endozoicomonas sp. TaxID=1892382 RepID=UPI003D9BB555